MPFNGAHRNLLGRAPERLHEEITADYTDMIYTAAAERRSENGARPSSARGGSAIGPSPIASKGPATPTSPSPVCRHRNGEAVACRSGSLGGLMQLGEGELRNPVDVHEQVELRVEDILGLRLQDGERRKAGPPYARTIRTS